MEGGGERGFVELVDGFCEDLEGDEVSEGCCCCGGGCCCCCWLWVGTCLGADEGQVILLRGFWCRSSWTDGVGSGKCYCAAELCYRTGSVSGEEWCGWWCWMLLTSSFTWCWRATARALREGVGERVYAFLG